MNRSNSRQTRWLWRGVTALVVVLATLCCAAPTLAQVARPEDEAGSVIAEVRVVGNRNVPTAKVLAKIRTRAGAPLDLAQLREDQRTLVRTKWFEDVGVELKREPHGLVVIFRVLEGNKLSRVEIVGNVVFDDERLQKEAGLELAGPIDGAFLHEAARRIEEFYHRNGFPFAEARVVQGVRPGEQKAVIRVVEGPLTRVRSIDFVGNESVSGALLRTKIDSSRSMLGLVRGKLNLEMIDNDVHRIATYYRSLGYFDVQVSREVRYSPDRTRAYVTFYITEGPRYVVRSVRIEGNRQVSAEELLPEPALKAGDFYTERAARRDARQIRRALGERGFVDAQVRPDLRFSATPGTVDVVFRVHEGQAYRVGRIEIEGNTVTRDRVIRRQLRVYPGEVLNAELLEESERRLRNTQLFQINPATGQGPTIDVLGDDKGAAGEGPNLRDLVVRVQEGQTGRIVFGLGYNTDAGLIGNILISERNFDITRWPTSWEDIWSGRAFRGGGQEFRLELAPGTELSRYLFSWREPMIFDLPYSFGITGYYYQRNYREWDEQREGGTLTLGHEFSDTVRGSLGLRIENVNISDPDVPTPPDLLAVLGDNFQTIISAQIQHDTRDNVFLPSGGHLYRLIFEQGLGDYTFPKVTLEGRHYWTLWERPDGTGKQVLSARGILGIAGDETPIYERFFAGGYRNFRGFDFRGVGPKVFDVHVGGEFLMVGSLEYLFPITADETLRGVIFTDFGTLESDVEITEFRVTAGAGVRVALPFFGPMPIAIDFAFPINKADGDDTQVVSFFFGFFR